VTGHNRPEAGNDDGVVFENQADVLVNTRLAADCVGATRMDRPEWGSVHPRTGEVYKTLTNSGRSAGAVDPANPRAPNPYGHIIRGREDGDDHGGLTFLWDIFASPDGLWIDQFGT
jgi:secreted PhoX family phosphatase